MRDDHLGGQPIPTPADVAAARKAAPPAPSPSATPRSSPRKASGGVAPAAAAAAEAGPPKRPGVVIAEDEALIRLDLKETLEELGYDVVGEAGDGERAVQLTEQLRPDLVILDVKMPVLDGISAAQRIAASRLAPVVILTAFSQRDLVERARDAGAMAYLVKPFSSSELLPAIEIALSRYAEVAALEAEVSDLNDRLESRKVIDRAKGVLQATRQFTEPEAFKWIQRAAMDQRISMRAVAEAIVSEPTNSAADPAS